MPVKKNPQKTTVAKTVTHTNKPVIDLPADSEVKQVIPVILVDDIMDVRFKDKDGRLYRL